MNITVEFTGGTRAMAGAREVNLDFPAGVTYRGVVGRLADLFPGLVGAVIAEDKRTLLSAMIFDRNGSETILPGMLDQTPQNGDRLLLLYFIVGG
jgi:hypothetical protein